MKRKIKSEEVGSYIAESRGLERDYLYELQKSAKRAWLVAGTASVAALAAIAGIAGLTPLKQSVPFVLRVDNATGRVDPVTQLGNGQETYGEAVDKYFLNTYVLNREGYDYNTVQATYNTTALLSGPLVQKEFFALYEGPEGRDKKLTNRARIVTNVISITPTGAKGSAVVRFTTQQVNANGDPAPVLPWVATIGYRYINAPTQENDRRINPLGFQVTSYRADPEVVR